MKIFKISANSSAQQQEMQDAIGTVQAAIATINKSITTLAALPTNQTGRELFQKDGIRNALQNGNIRNVDQNMIRQSLGNMGTILQSILAINEQFRVLENSGINVQQDVIPKVVAGLQTPNPQAFQSSMSGFVNNLSAMTGTTSAIPTRNILII